MQVWLNRCTYNDSAWWVNQQFSFAAYWWVSASISWLYHHSLLSKEEEAKWDHKNLLCLLWRNLTQHDRPTPQTPVWWLTDSSLMCLLKAGASPRIQAINNRQWLSHFQKCWLTAWVWDSGDFLYNPKLVLYAGQPELVGKMVCELQVSNDYRDPSSHHQPCWPFSINFTCFVSLVPVDVWIGVPTLAIMRAFVAFVFRVCWSK